MKAWWKPRGKTWINEKDWFVYMNRGKCIRLHKWVYANNILCWEYNLRELASKESWLWQFVCKNGMVKHDQYTNTTRMQEYEDERDSETYRTKYDEWSYLFRLIESALKDESELEQFLLDNIKVKWKSTN